MRRKKGQGFKKKRFKNIGICMASVVLVFALAKEPLAFFCSQIGRGVWQKSAYTIMEITSPNLTFQTREQNASLMEWIARKVEALFPIIQYWREQQERTTWMESVMEYRPLQIEPEEVQASTETKEEVPSGIPIGECEWDEDAKEEEEEARDKELGYSKDFRDDVLKIYKRKDLKSYDYLMKEFYHVDATTQLTKKRLQFEKLFRKDLSIHQDQEPTVLIYHTHSQEGYKASKTSKGKTVVDVGDELTRLLTDKYGLKVIHHKGEYDKKDRDSAYSRALPAIEKILEQNPSIQVIIDLHRDGVGNNTRLVTKIGKKKMAQVMFFNGVSRSKLRGELPYLENKNLSGNLAFSLQMQLASRVYFPTLTRNIYIKGYRYNMHLLPRTLLVEVGAQTNTFEEAKNAMGPLAFVLSRVLQP